MSLPGKLTFCICKEERKRFASDPTHVLRNDLDGSGQISHLSLALIDYGRLCLGWVVSEASSRLNEN